MNEKLILPVVEKIITEIFQNAAYLFAEKLAPWDQPEFSKWMPLGAEIVYSGQETGYIRLWADEALARTIAMNMLGMDCDVNIAKGKCVDALKEILNMIAGNFITVYYGENSNIRIGLPSLPADSYFRRDFENKESLWFYVEGHIMLVATEIAT